MNKTAQKTAQKAAHQLTEAGVKTGERLSDVGEIIAAEASEIAERLADWLADNDTVDQARDVASESLHAAKEWSSTLPARLAAALPVVATVPAKPKKRTLFGMFALGAVVAYFFDPTSGSSRREAMKQKVSGMLGKTSVTGEQAA